MSVLASADAQRDCALKKANAVRSARKDLRDELQTVQADEAAVRIAALIEHPPAFLHSMLVFDLFRGLWRWGSMTAHRSAKAKALMRSAGIDPWAEVGGLTDRQRQIVAELLRRRGVR